MPPETPAKELAFGQIAVSRKFATDEQVADCLEFRRRCAEETGEEPSLARIMVARDILTRHQAGTIIDDVIAGAIKSGGAVADEEGITAAANAELDSAEKATAREPAQKPKAITVPRVKKPSATGINVNQGSARRIASASAPKEIPMDMAPAGPALAPVEEEIPENGIQGYKILDKIGTGSMGAVYKAHQISMDRLVALKVLPSAMTQNEAFVNQFLSEARGAGRLNHPNVIRVHEVGCAGGIYYYSMEYVSGEPLDALIKRSMQIEPLRCHGIMLQVAHALDHGWRNGLNHREVRPEAIMIDAEDQTKLADLGITKVGSTKFVMGANAQYVAPEQVQGGETDTRTDIYSFGCTFYHALAGRQPFRGNTPKEILSCHLSEMATPLSELNPAVPPVLSAIVAKCMEKLPERRFQSPAELIEGLNQVSFKPKAPAGKSAKASAVSGRRSSRRGSGRTKRRRRRR